MRMLTAVGLPSLHVRGLWELVGFVETGEQEPLVKEEAPLLSGGLALM